GAMVDGPRRPGPLRAAPGRGELGAQRPSSLSRSDSNSVGTPARCAFISFDWPGSSPTIRPVVLPETESDTLAPSASSAAFASSRVYLSSVPVTTQVEPGIEPATVRSAS